jgi:fructose-specific phosphotransferase system IIC component
MKRDLIRHSLTTCLRIVAAKLRIRRFSGALRCGPPPYVGGYRSTAILRGALSYGVVLLPGLLAGCSRAPTFDIVGSLFPAWIVCLVLGILAAILTRWLLLRLKVTLVLPVLLYPSLAAFFTFLLWLILFS